MVFQDLEEIQRYKGQQSNSKLPLVAGIRLLDLNCVSRSENKLETKQSRVLGTHGDTWHIQQGKGDGLDLSGSTFGGHVTHEQTG